MAKSKSLNIYLKKARRDVGLSQGEVAAHLGYSSPQFISNWERGLSSPPLDKLSDLVKLYRISGKELVDVMLYEARRDLLRAVSGK